MTYKPRDETQETLDWCLKRVQSVDYKVTARWLFYRLVEEVLKPKGLDTKQAKKHYKAFLQTTSRARKRFFNGWAPDTLADDTRRAFERGFGYQSEKEWLAHFKTERCLLDKYSAQDHIVEIWFEAEAMYSQFDYYTFPYRLTLRPFKGDPSIDYKWKIAKDLEYLGRYRKPITILYFGDYDEKGLLIPQSAVKDIRAWCGVNFNFLRCGINKEQIVEWGIVESFDKEGTFQWEALSEDRAESLILSNVEPFWSLRKVRAIQHEEDKSTKKWKKLLESAMS